MRIKIINPVNSCELDVSRTMFVAALKAKYIDSDGFEGDKGFVQLVFRGRPLEDLKQLKDYGIENGCILAHIHVKSSGAAPASVNYKGVAEHLESARASSLGGRMDPDDYSREAENTSWSAEWSRGREWETMPAVLVGSTGVSRADIWEEHDTDYAGGHPTPARLLTDTSRATAPPPEEGAAAPYSANNPFDSNVKTATPKPAAEAMRETFLKEREAARARQALVSRKPEFIAPYSTNTGINISPPTRFFRHIYVAQVGRFSFRVLHRLEGRWTGDAEVHLPGRATATPDARVCTVSLVFDDIAGVWRENQSLTTRDGLVSMQGMILRPIADGTCSVELVDGNPLSPAEPRSRAARRPASSTSFNHTHSGLHDSSTNGSGGDRAAAKEYDMTLAEQSEHLLVLTAYSRATGLPVLVETMTLISDMARVRTVQRFDDSGSLQCMYLIREERVIDAVTGAVVEPPKVRPGYVSPYRAAVSGTHV